VTHRRRPLAGTDAARRRALLRAVNAFSAAAGEGLGAITWTIVPLLLVRFFIGVLVGIAVVANRFRQTF
jgi:hypothetical protein